jgi:hypothetical protein
VSKHIIVTGPGRCGTSAFVKLLHNLGQHTGFCRATVNRDWGSGGSGLEWPIRGKHVKHPMPHVIKNPSLSMNLVERAERWGWSIDHVFILVRKPEDIVMSRFERTRGVGADVSDEDAQEHLTKAYLYAGKALLTCVGKGYPYTIIEYPRWAKDSGYCFEKVRPLCKSLNHFLEAHEKTVDRSKLR